MIPAEKSKALTVGTLRLDLDEHRAWGGATEVVLTVTEFSILRVLMGEQLQLPAKVWHRLNFAWVAFFAVMGLLNLWVAYHFSTSTWVNFKLFGGLGLMLAFTVAQGLYLSQYLKDDAAVPAKPPTDTV